MAGHLSPQQFGPYVPHNLIAHASVAGHMGGAEGSTVPEQLGKKIPGELSRISNKALAIAAARLGYGSPN